MLAAYSSSPGSSPGPGTGPEREPSHPRPAALRLPADLSTLERTRLGAAAGAPTEGALPDLLNMRAEVATVVYRPLESPKDGSGCGWRSETLYFHLPQEGGYG